MKFSKKVIAAVTATALISSALSFMPQTMTSQAAGSKEAIDLVNSMGEGWNLGNALDSWDSGVTTFSSVTQHETDWGQPSTTKAIIDAIHDAGYKTIRVPVSWWQEMDSKHNVKPEFMARVKEIVNWCIEDGMYVILNVHHDGGTGTTGFLTNNFDNKEEYEYLWNQIASEFKNYDNHLIFESANELTWKNSDNSYNYDDLNELNQTFVNLIRKSGGKNTDRLLLLAGACTDLTDTCNEKFVVPDDPMVAVSIHYYLPSTWCVESATNPWTYQDGNGQTKTITPQTTWGADSDYQILADNFAKMAARFTENNIPVILGEYGVCEFDQRKWDDIIDYTKAVCSMSDSFDGFCPVLWDACYNESVGYFLRKDLKWTNSDFENAVKDINKGNYTNYKNCFTKTKNVTMKGSDIKTNDSNLTISSTPTGDLESVDINVSSNAGFQVALNYNNNSGNWVYATVTDSGFGEAGGNNSKSQISSATTTKNADGTYTIHAEIPSGEINGALSAQLWYSGDPNFTFNSMTFNYASPQYSFDKSKAVEITNGNEPLAEPNTIPSDEGDNTTTTAAVTTTSAPTTTVTDPVETTTTKVETTTAKPKTTSKAPETTTAIKTTTSATKATTSEPSSETKGDNQVPDGKVTVWGDIDCNGSVAISDAVLLNRGLAGISKISDQGLINANIYQVGDGKKVIDANDAEYHLKYLVSVLTQLPYVG